MLIVLRAILALAADLAVCYLCGELVLHNFFRKIHHTFANILMGFLVCQIVFEIITLCCYFLGKNLAAVTTVWLCIVGIIFLSGTGKLVQSKQSLFRKPKGENIMPIIVAAFSVLLFCYYVSINGETDADSRYYISLVNTTLNTGTIFQYNPYNGIYGNAWYLRRALATYEIHSAVLCRVFQVPALVVTRITRACQNVILTSMAVYLLGSRVLWRNHGDSEAASVQTKSCYLVTLFLFLQLVYAGTYPSSAKFFLTRAYEGKALTANLLVLLTMYLCAEVFYSKQMRYVILLILALWGAAAISSSGMVVIGIEIAIFLAAYIMKRFVERYRNRKHV